MRQVRCAAGRAHPSPIGPEENPLPRADSPEILFFLYQADLLRGQPWQTVKTFATWVLQQCERTYLVQGPWKRVAATSS